MEERRGRCHLVQPIVAYVYLLAVNVVVALQGEVCWDRAKNDFCWSGRHSGGRCWCGGSGDCGLFGVGNDGLREDGGEQKGGRGNLLKSGNDTDSE